MTFASEILPTAVSSLGRDTFRVWGPVGSSGNWRAFVREPREPGWFSDAVKQVIRDQVSPIIARWISRRVDLVLAQTDDVALKLSGSVRTVVFPNVVLPSRLVDEVDLGEADRDSEDHDENRPLRIVSAGHLTSRKRFALALAAMRSPELSNSRLLLAGAPLPGTRNYLPGLAKTLGVDGRVTFLGKIPRGDLMKLLSTADVFVHLSAREGAPGIVGEATSAGTPVVCLEGTGSSAILRLSGGNGVSLNSSDLSTEGIAHAVRSAASMRRRPFSGWSEGRIRDMIDQVLDEAIKRRGEKN
ncbi:glycosyltransferase family 4 protein [Cnuibacter sp. UC19_7]|uniref:glycosyltransferase family 4 protein n=1 Tax=Cnuibacter sp. UC19_7 TaxID=3350166 RepID=UPI00366D9B22